MEKIYNYILKGRGMGLLLLLLLSFVVSVIFAIYIKVGGTDFIPYAQSVSDQMLPIRIENGIVTEPKDTVKVAQLKIDDYQAINLPFVIDTRVDTLDASTLKDGVYLTRTMIYTINNNQIKMQKLTGSAYLPREDYQDLFKSVLTWTAVTIGILGIIGIFAVNFLLSLFYALCSYAITLISSKKYDFDQRMRMSVISFVSVYIVFSVLSWGLGITTGRLIFFIIVVALQSFLIYKMPSGIETSAEETPNETSKE